MSYLNNYTVHASKQQSESNMSVKTTLCTQLSGILFFGIGLAVGIIIGYFAMTPRNTEPVMVTCNCPVTTPQPGVMTTTYPLTTNDPVGVSTQTTGVPASNVSSPVPMCPPRSIPTKSTTSLERGIFEPLTVEEITEVQNFMILNDLTKAASVLPMIQDDFIYGIALMVPNKSEALSYLDAGGMKPGRYADVHVHRGSRTVPDIMEYRVGPLGGAMQITPLFQDGELHFNSRPRDAIEYTMMKLLVGREMEILKPMLQESFDGAYFPDGGLTWHPQAPPGLTKEERETRFTMYLSEDGIDRGRDLNPMPMSATVHNPGIDVGTWYIHSYYYLNQGPYPDVNQLLEAYMNGTLKKFKLPTGYRQTVFSHTFPKENSEKRRPMSNKSPPRSYNPSGQRFTVHDHTVKWMGWEFTIGMSMFRGASIYNAHFKGQRILYENSLNEVNIVYSSDTSSQANTLYLDSSFGLGEFQDLIVGVDCPDHAVLLEAAWFPNWDQKAKSGKAICVFESAGEESLWRRQGSFAAGLPDHHLVVRYIQPLGNYDYTFDFIFYLDGVMKTETAASGFMQAAFWDPENVNAGDDKETDAFGYRIGPFTHGALHDHTFGYKVDLDVGGTENNFELIHWKAGDVSEAIASQVTGAERPNYFLYNQTRYVEWETLERESGLRIDMINPQFWTVSNENVRNKWGVRKAYRIIPQTTVAQVLTDDHPAMRGFTYTKYHCTVTKYKDSEKFISDPYAGFNLADSRTTLDDFINDEPIRNEDLVTWISFGFLHLPTAEDMPMTLAGKSGFILKPFNYFDNTPTFDVPHFVDTPDDLHDSRMPLMEPCIERKQDSCYFCD